MMRLIVLLFATLAGAVEFDSLRNVEKEVGSSQPKHAPRHVPKQRVSVGDAGGISSLLATLPHELVPSFDELSTGDFTVNDYLEKTITQIHDLYEEVASDAQNTLDTMLTRCGQAYTSAADAADLTPWTDAKTAFQAYKTEGDAYYVTQNTCPQSAPAAASCYTFCTTYDDDENDDGNDGRGGSGALCGANRWSDGAGDKTYFDVANGPGGDGAVDNFLDIDDAFISDDMSSGSVLTEITRAGDAMKSYFRDYKDCQTKFNAYDATKQTPDDKCADLVTARNTVTDAFVSCLDSAIAAKTELEGKLTEETNTMIGLEQMIRRILCVVGNQASTNNCDTNYANYDHSFGRLDRQGDLTVGSWTVNGGALDSNTANVKAQILGIWSAQIGAGGACDAAPTVVAGTGADTPDASPVDEAAYVATYPMMRVEFVSDDSGKINRPALVFSGTPLSAITAKTDGCLGDTQCKIGAEWAGRCYDNPDTASQAYRCACFAGFVADAAGTACVEIDGCQQGFDASGQAEVTENVCLGDPAGNTCTDVAGCTQSAMYPTDTTCADKTPAEIVAYESGHTCGPP